MGLPICEFSALLPIRIRGLPVCIRGSVCDVSVTHQQSCVESRIQPVFFCMQMHMHSHKKNITDDDCDDTTGDEVNDDGNGAM